MPTVLFEKVRDFEKFLTDLANILNMEKVREKFRFQKIKLYLESQKVETLGTNDGKIQGGGITQTWVVIDNTNGKIGEINATLLTPMFFVLGDGWKLIKDHILIESLFEPNQDGKKNKEALKMIEREKEKLKKMVKGELEDRLDHNLALFLKNWYVPIQPVAFEIFDHVDGSFVKFMERLSKNYENEFPVKGLDEIVPNLIKISIEVGEYPISDYIDWNKID